MNLKLWGYSTSRTLRPHWALHELDLPYTTKYIRHREGETQTEEFTKLNPLRKVPVLQDDKLVVTESAAICVYLADRYGNGKLISDIAEGRSHVFQLCFFSMTELDAHTLYILTKHNGKHSSVYGKSPEATAAAIQGFEKQVATLSMTLDDGRPYIVGDSFTIADIILTTCLTWSQNDESIGLQLEVPPILLEYATRMKAREAYTAAFKTNYPEATVSSAVPG